MFRNKEVNTATFSLEILQTGLFMERINKRECSKVLRSFSISKNSQIVGIWK